MSYEHLYNLQYDVSRIKLPSLVMEACLFSLCTRFCILCIGIDYSLDVHLINTRTKSPESMVVIMHTLCFFHTGGSKLNLAVQQRHFAQPEMYMNQYSNIKATKDTTDKTYSKESRVTTYRNMKDNERLALLAVGKRTVFSEWKKTRSKCLPLKSKHQFMQAHACQETTY